MSVEKIYNQVQEPLPKTVVNIIYTYWVMEPKQRLRVIKASPQLVNILRILRSGCQQTLIYFADTTTDAGKMSDTSRIRPAGEKRTTEIYLRKP